ncbi:MAB_1171c family putative transporter [Paractinoplanes maris]|uniref:MAB_1171c family putative transporter n=1 Tax=Paractinoplanes maris TaxID=1734446 RepID=UPI00201FF9CA|nr:MAB_1171c family putative transporter [Actinoplanes maris]
MRAAIFLPMAVGCMASLALRVDSLRRDPHNPFLRSVCVVLALTTTGAIAGIPAVATPLETSSGIVAVWILVPVTAAGAAVWSMFLLWTYPLSRAAGKIRAGLVFYVIAIAVIIALTVESQGSITAEEIIRNEEEPESLWAVTPYVRDAYLIYTAVTGFIWANAAVSSVLLVRLVDRRWLRRGLWTLFSAYVLFFLHAASVAGYFISVRVGSDIPVLRDAGLICAGLAGILSTAGVVLPTLGPRWDRLLWYRRLEPLWSAIYETVPHVALERPGTTRLDGWNPWGSDFRVYRRVIEIRDGILALRAHFDREVGALARHLGHAAGQTGSELDATVMAAQLTAAIRDKQNGLSPHRQDITENPPRSGGHDLDSEIDLLLPLTKAFSTSQIVRTATAARPRLGGPALMAVNDEEDQEADGAVPAR